MIHTKAPSHSPFWWDLLCLASLVGAWPRFVEPQLISTTRLSLKIPQLSADLKGFKIVHISDLHLHPYTPQSFLEKLVKKTSALNPDLIVFTGDFLCYARLDQPERLEALLNRFHAPYGCYAVLGNHDYAENISVNAQGDYDLVHSSSSLGKAFRRLFKTTRLTGNVTEQARHVTLHKKLPALLAKTPFKLLHNNHEIISVKKAKLNICGLSEYMQGRLDAKKTFQKYDTRYPGIILLHNPDGIPFLKEYPGDIILCGHTHGGQVNLPGIWQKFTLQENMKFKKGLYKVDSRWVYINRGLGSVLTFRLFSPPEILSLTLE